MTKINIHEAKTHLSRYAARVKAGETIVLCDRNVPFAEIRPLSPERPRKKRKAGLYKGKIKMIGDWKEGDREVLKMFQDAGLA
jgi:antitoxin (DNA-binding transcriptional repressor) of toxin-antitoxin stability system